MARLAAEQFGIEADLGLVAEAGIIGLPLPMELVRANLPRVQLKPEGGHEAAQAIMTTDTRIKEAAVALEIGGRGMRSRAVTKGVGPIFTNTAPLLPVTRPQPAPHPQLP